MILESKSTLAVFSSLRLTIICLLVSHATAPSASPPQSELLPAIISKPAHLSSGTAMQSPVFSSLDTSPDFTVTVCFESKEETTINGFTVGVSPGLPPFPEGVSSSVPQPAPNKLSNAVSIKI